MMSALAPSNAGRYDATGSSRRSLPSSTNVITVADVSHLLADAIGITVVAVVSPTASAVHGVAVARDEQHAAGEAVVAHAHPHRARRPLRTDPAAPAALARATNAP